MSGSVLLVVAVALIDTEGRLLLARRPQNKSFGGLWELPGGKLEPGETPERALQRELQEELQIEVQEADLDPLTFASFSYASFHLLMPVFACRRWEGAVTAREHSELAWVSLSRLADYPAPPADIRLFEVLPARLNQDMRR